MNVCNPVTTPHDAYIALHEARVAIRIVADAFASDTAVVYADLNVSRAIDALTTAINQTVSRPVPACKLRVGDKVAISAGNVPDLTVSVAEYAPQNGCIAFRVGFEEIGLMHTSGWRENGIYSWSNSFMASPVDAVTINARTDLYHEAYPEGPKS